MKTRAQNIKDTITDGISDLMYYRRKEDDELPRGAIEEAVEAGEITVDEMIETFATELRKCF